jgi:hypothetical protein
MNSPVGSDRHPFDARTGSDSPQDLRARDLDRQIDELRGEIRDVHQKREGSASWTAARDLQKKIYRAREELNQIHVKAASRSRDGNGQ